ncbi:MAG: transcription elongation factor GreA [Patulibacter sp.]|nr:transcription elongation factor GreA [Patulibacter sp.]
MAILPAPFDGRVGSSVTPELLDQRLGFRRGTRSAKGLTLSKDVILTHEGLEKLKQELDHLTTVKRREVAERIKDARDFGDISENSEYDDAKNEQAMIEGRILDIEEQLRSASVIDESSLSTDEVQVGTRVTVRNEKGTEQEYALVGSAEANPAENKLSNESPVGKALIGKPQGASVKVNLPNGKTRTLEIVSISR